MDKNVMRFVLDCRDCSESGDACKAAMMPSVAGAFVYFSELEALEALNATQADSIKEFQAQQKKMREALDRCYSAIRSLPESALEIDPQYGHWLRDELMARIESAITPKGEQK